MLLGALASLREAGVYGVASRYALFGTLALQGSLLIVAPQVARLSSRGSFRALQELYQTVTWWLVTLSFPFYLLLILFPSPFLRIFGNSFEAGTTTLVVVSAFMLVNIATGPVSVVLLMMGKSSWNLANTIMTIVASIGLSVILIPQMGITGAAVAWGVSIMVENLIPLLQIWRLHGLHPFGGGFLRASGTAIMTVGTIGCGVRLFGSDTMVGAIETVTIGGPLFAVLIYRQRHALRLDLLIDSLRPMGRRRSSGAAPLGNDGGVG
ncbi:MAG: oligosaccharide flippase family protein [Candidatus Dormiibacterota bacterium]